MALQIFKVPEYPDHLGMEGKSVAVTPWSSYISKTESSLKRLRAYCFPSASVGLPKQYV